MDSWWLHFSQAPVRELPDMCFDMQTEHYGSGYFIAKTENKVGFHQHGSPFPSAILKMHPDTESGGD